jgi:hypothetical protein
MMSHLTRLARSEKAVVVFNPPVPLDPEMPRI